jgi:hypothetical protein
MCVSHEHVAAVAWNGGLACRQRRPFASDVTLTRPAHQGKLGRQQPGAGSGTTSMSRCGRYPATTRGGTQFNKHMWSTFRPVLAPQWAIAAFGLYVRRVPQHLHCRCSPSLAVPQLQPKAARRPRRRQPGRSARGDASRCRADRGGLHPAQLMAWRRAILYGVYAQDRMALRLIPIAPTLTSSTDSHGRFRGHARNPLAGRRHFPGGPAPPAAQPRASRVIQDVRSRPPDCIAATQSQPQPQALDKLGMASAQPAFAAWSASQRRSSNPPKAPRSPRKR